MDALWHWPIVFLAGIAGGFVNTVAGGASLLCMPTLYFLGLPAVVANASNNIATTCQSLFAAIRYRQEGFGNLRISALLALPAVVGAVVGALLVTAMDEGLFRKVVGVLMLFALIVIVKTAPQSDGQSVKPPSAFRQWMGGCAVAFLAVYGGFFGGGVGILLLPLIAFSFGQDFVTANGVKSAVVFLMNISAAIVFVYHGLGEWLPAGVLIVGMILGAQLGVRMAVSGGERWVKRILVAVTTFAAVIFLWP